MDEGVNRKRKALELSERARVHLCPAGFMQAETHSADRWAIIRQVTKKSLPLQETKCVCLGYKLYLHEVGEVK